MTCYPGQHPRKNLAFRPPAIDLQPFQKLDKHSIGISRDYGSNWAERLGFLGQKRYSAPLQSLCGCIDIRNTKREAIDPHVVQCMVSLTCEGTGPTTAPGR